MTTRHSADSSDSNHSGSLPAVEHSGSLPAVTRCAAEPNQLAQAEPTPTNAGHDAPPTRHPAKGRAATTLAEQQEELGEQRHGKNGQTQTSGACSKKPAGTHADHAMARKGRHNGDAYDPDLGRHPVPSIRNRRLMEATTTDDNIIAAAEAMMRKPDKAPGVDHKTVTAVCKPLLSFAKNREELRTALLDGKYRPGEVRVQHIPKGHGKSRKLGIAIVQDRLVQRMILQAVEDNIPDGAWSDCALAYRHGMGVADAIGIANGFIADGHKYAVCVDLKAFFDHVPHNRLLRKLDEHIADKRVARLAKAFVTPVLRDNGKKSINRMGTPQGSVIAPWLASMLYMDEFDRETEMRGHAFLRYADDIVAFCRSKAAANRVRERTIAFLTETMGCPVNQDKTKVVPVERLSLLGLQRSGDAWRIPRYKERDACGKAKKLLARFAETGNTRLRDKARQKFQGWLQTYRQIPGMAPNEVPALERWFERRTLEFTNKAIERRREPDAADTPSPPG